mmetsp:Transcript_56616/g.157730  ORF Transcript_56616/g.157730 Transcript_56616/m.157730 type:complete len:630 (+) Transcript_56616:2-1891(+)
MAAVKKCPASLQYAAEKVSGSHYVVMFALRTDGTLLRFAHPDLQEDSDVVQLAIVTCGLALEFASADLRDDDELVMTAIKQNGLALEFASSRLQNNETIVDTATKENPEAIQFATERWRNDAELVEPLAERNGLILRHMSELRDHGGVVGTAVRQNGRALAEASHRLRNDKSVVSDAVRQDGTALLFASPELRGDPDVVMAALGQQGMALAYASDAMLMNYEIVLAALAQDGMALVHAPDVLRDTAEIVTAAVAQNGFALEFASFRLRMDIEVCLVAVGQNPDAMKFVANELTRDSVFMEFSLAQQPDFAQILAPKPKMVARKWAMAMVRRTLEPELKKLAFPWPEAVQLLRAVVSDSSIASLQDVFEDPEAFVGAVAETDGLAGRLWIIRFARDSFEAVMAKREIAWEDMQRVLLAQAEASMEDLRAACKSPKAWVDELDEMSEGRVAQQWIIAKLRPHMTQYLPPGITFDDMWPVLEAVDSLRQLASFIKTPKNLVSKIVGERPWPAAVKYIPVGTKPTVLPKLPEDMHWSDFLSVLHALEPLKEVEEMVSDWVKFRKKLALDVNWPPTKYWTIAQLRPKVEAAFLLECSDWEEVLPSIREMDMVSELMPALEDPRDLVRRLIAEIG